MKKHLFHVSLVMFCAIAAYLVFVSMNAYGAAERGRRDIIVGSVDFDEDDLTGDGVHSRKTFDYDYDGVVDQIRVYKSGGSCDSIEWWLLEEDTGATSTAKSHLAIIADNEGNPQADSYTSWRPPEGPVVFKTKVTNVAGATVGKLAIEVKANGGACSASFKVFGRRY